MTAFLNDSLDIKSQCSTFCEILRFRALKQPDKTAFTFLQSGGIESHKLTYQMLDTKARAIASQLLQTVKPGDRALMLYPPGLEFISAFFGCLYAGVIAVPAYPPKAKNNLHRLQAIIADAQAVITLTPSTLLPQLQEKWEKDPTVDSIKWLATDTVDENFAQDWYLPNISSNSLAFLQYTSGSTGKPKGVMVTHSNLLSNERAIEKAFGHGDDTILVAWLPLFHDMGLVGNVLQPLYLGIPCHLMSPVDFVQKPFRWLEAISRYRATTSGGPNFAYDLCLRKITAEQIATLDLSCWQLAFSGAEPVRAETIEKFSETFAHRGFRKEAFYPCYGMAEATLFITGGLKTHPPIIGQFEANALTENEIVKVNNLGENTRSIVGCGQPGLDHKVIVVDPDTLTQNLPAKVGEIWVSGSSVAQGYWQRPQQTAETFQAFLADTREGPFLRTGDLGFLMDNELFVTGRLKDVIIIRGRNYYPHDIELTVEKSHQAIRRPGCCAAFAIEVDGEERLVVVAEIDRRYHSHRQQKTNPPTSEILEHRKLGKRRQVDVDVTSMASLGEPLSIDTVISSIRQAIAEEYQLQLHALCLLKIGSIPRTSSGKIQRYACKNAVLNNSLDVVGVWQSDPKNESKTSSREPQKSEISQAQAPIQTWLIWQIAQYLKLRPEEIDIQAPLTCYGLDSIQAVSIIASLEEQLNLQLTPDLLDIYPSIVQLSKYLSDRTATTNSSPVANYFHQPTAAKLVWNGTRIFYNRWLQMEVQGLANIPQNQPYLLAANHTSHLDSGAVIVALGEQVDNVAVLSAQDYFFNTPLKGWLFKTFLNLIPFDRQKNFLAALRECQSRISPRNPILIFPEGTRSITGDLQPFQAGLGLLALKLNIPLIPVNIQGTFEVLPKGKILPRKHPIRVTFGAPLPIFLYQAKLGTIAEREICDKICQDVQCAVEKLGSQLSHPHQQGGTRI
ncbi:AMP-binding protein [Microcoleus sp. D2_18a_D3]|uniref:AMP-binding protein n=1 Tax=Microcoleus sp. D2_18a_D3 TaxID=3055330 RepID=UPI002FD48E05